MNESVKINTDDMNNFDDDRKTQFGFSGVKKQVLDEDIYTLATIVLDTSTSLRGQESELERLLKVIVNRLSKSSRSEHILLRVVKFNTDIKEIHGFIPVNSIDVNTYENIICCGWTALYAALYDSFSAKNSYAEYLLTEGYDINCCLYICTDGEENRSSELQISLNDVKKAVNSIMRNEEIESCVTALFGLNDPNASTRRQQEVSDYLSKLVKDLGIGTFIDSVDVSEKTITKIGDIISESISSQADAIVIGTPSSHIITNKVF